MGEVWKDIDGYVGYYQVSSHGRVRSLPRTVNGRFYKGRVRSTKLNNKKQYPKISLYVNGVSTYYKVHQLVARSFIPNPENKREVNHIDGNKLNNHIDNLEWVTSKENKEHNKKLGITRIGSRHQNSIINEEIALEIKKMLHQGVKQKDIAKLFGIGESIVSEVKLEKTWVHVIFSP